MGLQVPERFLPQRETPLIMAGKDRGMRVQRIGILTGGGDCPGLNAAIHAVVRAGIKEGIETVGIRNGWLGLIDDDLEPLTDFSVSSLLPRGGTILGTSKTDPLGKARDFRKIQHTIRRKKIDALVVIGGDGTLSAASDMAVKGVRLVGIPKTIDNDVVGTEATIGFNTAVSIVTEAIDRLHTTAESHHRIMVVEVMGRTAGWIALMGGIAGGADVILIPEVRFSMDDVYSYLRERHDAGKTFSIVAVAEGIHREDVGAPPVSDDKRNECGHEKFVGVGNLIGKKIEHHLAIETRVTILGHVQRGGSPTAYDRILATRFGAAAIGFIRDGGFGKMTALKDDTIIGIPLENVARRRKPADPAIYRLAKTVTWGRE